ncbi:MAG: methyltransferase domain-containing protein [Proteobacteria bacterium]|nr:methyltransferase domain-containing protein [Pseudomonadota bacterium]
MSSPTPTPDPLTLALQQIRGLIEAGQLQPAAQALNAAQKQAPLDARVPLVGMRLAQRAGNLAGATQAARRALALAPGWHVAQIELGLLLAQQKQGEEAVQLAMQALAGAPKDSQVMVGAINVAHLSGQSDQAVAWAEDGVRRFPEVAGIRLFLARLLVALDRPKDAQAHYEVVHSRVPGHEETLRGLLSCAVRTGDNDKAAHWADELLALKPNDALVQYWHALTHGQMPTTQPPEVVTSIFDDYATNFDLHLVRGLKYQTPKLIADALLARFPDRKFNLLDLGCGTGLVGVYLGRIDGHIIGVDLSEKMIEQAARHGIYSRFHRVNVLDALRETPADHYEAISCADVLVYVGDLAPVIPNALRVLKPGGHFIFSCETAGEDEADLVLRPSQRYAHKASSVERQLREAGFDDIVIEHLPMLRMENNQPLPGFLAVARKPLTA